MRYYIVAGEASGDLHASNLIKAIRQKDPEARFRGCGGDLMRDAGAELLLHYKEMAFMGFWEVFVNLRTVLGNIKRCKTDILTWNPDVLVLVDYPGFNLRIAEFAKQRGLKTVYYISPQIWAWKKGRIKQIKRDVDEMMVILPFEKAFYAKNGMDVHYVGHPLLDAVSRDLPERPEVRNFRKDNGLDDREIIALLPGSRRQEVNALLPQMLNMAELFPQYQFVVSTVSWLPKEMYDTHLQTPAKTRTPVETCSSASLQNGDVQVNHNVRTVCCNTYALLANAKAASVASGTATLETALFRVPQVVCYFMQFRHLVSFLRPLVIKVPYISLVNLIAGKEVVPELVSEKMNAKTCREHLATILPGGSRREEMLRGYDEMARRLGAPGAPQKAAREMISCLKKGK